MCRIHPVMANLSGVHYYTIHENRLYFLKSNEATDAWELHIEEIR